MTRTCIPVSPYTGLSLTSGWHWEGWKWGVVGDLCERMWTVLGILCLNYLIWRIVLIWKPREAKRVRSLSMVTERVHHSQFKPRWQNSYHTVSRHISVFIFSSFREQMWLLWWVSLNQVFSLDKDTILPCLPQAPAFSPQMQSSSNNFFLKEEAWRRGYSMVH